MPPKKNENIDTSTYLDLGSFHWKTFTSNSGKYDPGKANFKPVVEMLSPDGYNKTFFDHEKQTKVVVEYDGEYVYEHYYQKLVVSMGWMDNGSLDGDVLKLFLDTFYTYCANVGERERLAHLDRRANELALEFPNLTAEQWKDFLIQQATKKEAPIVTNETSEVGNKKTTKSTKAVATD